jgi:hypothetical protein
LDDDADEGWQCFDECERYVDEAGDRTVVAFDVDPRVAREELTGEPLIVVRHGSRKVLVWVDMRDTVPSAEVAFFEDGRLLSVHVAAGG